MRAVLLATIGMLFSAWQGTSAQLQVPARRKAPEPTVTVELRVHVMCTSYGTGDGGDEKYPRTIAVNIPAGLKGSLSAYGAADHVWLAPRGWNGTAAVGADGTTVVELYPPSGHSSFGPHFVYRDTGGCAGCAMDDAAPYFPRAMKEAKESGDEVEQAPAGTEIQRLSPHVVTFSPPGRPGIMVHSTAYYVGKPTYFYAHVELAFPRSESTLTSFLLQYYVAHFRAWENSN